MKIGILGGGQLGRMFLQEAANYPLQVKILDPDPQAPCAHLCDEFVCGDFNDEATVFAFGQDCDAIGIEIEHVNVAALKRLQAQGKRIIPEPAVLEIIQDKGRQKAFYAEHGIPTAPFYLAANAADIDTQALPFVQKTRTGGYDGKGVQIIRNAADAAQLWDVPSVIESLCPIAKEIALIFVADGKGDVRTYPAAEMVFDPVLNLVDVVQMPAEISPEIAAQVDKICRQSAAAFAGAGVFAVEMFVTQSGEVWVNETACRVHNSGHPSIEACPSSQFDQMLRLLADYPLGSTQLLSAAAMINLIGAEGEQGAAEMRDLPALLAQEQVYLHWYGKHQVRSGRKMGHITLTASDTAALKTKIAALKQEIHLEITAKK